MKLIKSEEQNPQDYFLHDLLDWSPTTTYTIDDKCFHNGDGYVCVQGHIDQEPGVATGWEDYWSRLSKQAVYNKINQFIDDYAPAKAIRKKVFDGNADIVVLSDTIQIYWKDNLIAEAQLEGQVETSPDNWQGQLFSFADENIKKITWRTEYPDWDETTTYLNQNIVIHNETNYECILGHTDIEPGVDTGWEAYWRQLDPITPYYRLNEVKDIPVLGITDAVFGLDIKWAFKDTKMSFYLDVPGENVRIRWQCRVKDSAVATENTKGLKFSVEDYPGNVNKGSQDDTEEGWTIHWWTFEPDGYQVADADSRTPKERFGQGVGLMVDPYLRVDEQSTYYDIYMDGAVCRVHRDGSDAYLGEILDPDNLSTAWATFGAKVSVTSTYAISEDLAISVTLIEDSPLRVRIRAQGNFETSAQGDLSNEQDSIVLLTIYPDKIVQRTIFNATGSITLDNSAVNGFCFMDLVAANVASEDALYEDSGSITTASSDGEQNSADMIGLTSTEIDIYGINLEQSLGGGTASFGQYIDDPADGALRFRWNNGTITAKSEMTSIWILDSADRDGGKKYNNDADRLTLGDQYQDETLDPSPAKGDDVTDLIFPARIDSGTLHADGAHHYEGDSNDETKIALDRTRIRPAFMIHDFPFQYGSVDSPTDILLNHLKMDDNAANNDIIATVGPNADWHAVSDDASRNTSNDSIITDIFRGRGLDTKDAYYCKMAAGSGTVHDNDFLKKGSIIVKVTPQFGYDEVDNQHIFVMRYDNDNYINLYYSAVSDWFLFLTNWGSTQVTATEEESRTENYGLQREIIFLCSWDSDKDFLLLARDGQVTRFNTNTGSPTSSQPVACTYGGNNTNSLYGYYILDEIKTFSEAVLPYGAMFIGNGSGLLADIDNPHKDLTFFWDMEASGSNAAKGDTDLASDYTVTLSNGAALSGTQKIIGTQSLYISGWNHKAEITVTSDDIAALDEGSASFWLYPTVTTGAKDAFIIYGDSNDYVSIFIITGNTPVFHHMGNGTDRIITSDNSMTINTWNHLAMKWSESQDFIGFALNGQWQYDFISLGSTVANAGSIGFGLVRAVNDAFQGYYDQLFISKEPNTPEIWTAFGKPLHQPLTDLT